MWVISAQFSRSGVSTLWDPTDCSMPCFPVHHQLPELAQTHVLWVNDAIKPSHPLLSPSPPALNPSQVFSNESVLPIRWPKVLKFHVVGLNCARFFATPWSLWAPLSMEFSRQQYLSYIYIYSLLTSISPYSSFLFPFLSMYIPFQYLHLMCM